MCPFRTGTTVVTSPFRPQETPVIAVVTLLIAFPIGWFVRNRLAGFLVYGLVMAHLYTFQTAGLVMEWVNGSDAGFPQSKSTSMWGATWEYLLVTTLVYAVGLALVALGQRVRSRREVRRGTVELETVS